MAVAGVGVGDRRRSVRFVNRRRGADRAARRLQDLNLAADASEIRAVGEIGVAVLAESDHALGFACAMDVDRQRFGAAKILITVVERFPVRRREEIMGIGGMGQPRMKANDRLAIRPVAATERIARGDEQIGSVTGNSALCPDSAACVCRLPVGIQSRRARIDLRNGPVIVAAIAEMSALVHVEFVLEEQQGTALAVNGGVEGRTLIG